MYEEFIAALFESLMPAVLKTHQIHSRLKKKIFGNYFISCKHQLILKHNSTAFSPKEQPLSQLQHFINTLQWCVLKG